VTLKQSFIVVTVLLLIGCAEKPKTIGGSLIDPGSIFSTDTTTIYAAGDSTFIFAFSPGYGASNLAGRTALDEEAVSFFKFIPTAALDSLVNASIDTAEIRLIVNYRLGAAAVPIDFEVYEALSSWTQGALNKDSSAASAIGSTLLGTFSDSMNAGQTVTAQLTDTSTVRRWLQSYYDTSTADFNGFVVRPKAGSIPGIIGFTTFDNSYGYYPALVVKYTTKYGTHDSIFFTYGEDTFVGKLTATPSSFQVRGGFGVRSKLLFNLTPLVNKPILHKTTLTLVEDTTASLKGGYSPDSAIVFLGIKGTTLVDSFSTASYAFGVHSVDGYGNSVYQFNINVIAQSWLNSINSNDGLILRWASESSTAEKIVFYRSSDPDSLKRPRIKFMYSYR